LFSADSLLFVVVAVVVLDPGGATVDSDPGVAGVVGVDIAAAARLASALLPAASG